MPQRTCCQNKDESERTPRDGRGYRELGDAGNKTAHLEAKTRELIAIAVGVTRQCDGCITTHVHAARKQGATTEEIAEALGLAIAVNAGAALVFSARAMDAVLGGPAEQNRIESRSRGTDAVTENVIGRGCRVDTC